jgi:ATP-dependent Clp protease ATP-binding subunit ClpC
LELNEEAKEFLIRRGTDLDFGARPLRRAIEQRIEDPLSEELLRGAFEGQDTIIVKGVLENSDGKSIDAADMTITDEGKMIDPDGKKVKVVRLDFQGENRGRADNQEQAVSAGVGDSDEGNGDSES